MVTFQNKCAPTVVWARCVSDSLHTSSYLVFTWGPEVSTGSRASPVRNLRCQEMKDSPKVTLLTSGRAESWANNQSGGSEHRVWGGGGVGVCVCVKGAARPIRLIFIVSVSDLNIRASALPSTCHTQLRSWNTEFHSVTLDPVLEESRVWLLKNKDFTAA